MAEMYALGSGGWAPGSGCCTGKEFWLLKFFMEHPGQVFTKAQIYHHVWEDGYEDDNTVMVYISKLREKLEDKPNERIWIQTIRGIGYRFGGSR